MIVSCNFFGAANDKLIVKACEETKAIINGAMESVSHLYDASGNMLIIQGAYLIVAAGFLRIDCMTNLRHNLWLMQKVRWSEFLESIRKDYREPHVLTACINRIILSLLLNVFAVLRIYLAM